MLSVVLSVVGGSEVEALQAALHRAALAAQQVDTRAHETMSRPELCRALVPTIVAVIDEASDGLARVLARYDAAASQQGSGADPLDGPESSGIFDVRFEAIVEPGPARVPAPLALAQRVADASFMARWELHRKRGAVLRASERDDARGLLAECCSARRRVLKATSGVERVLSEVEGRPSVFEGLYRTERQLAVDTRAAFFAFVSRLRSGDLESMLEGMEVERGVRLAGTGIAKLVGRDVYQELRVEDRLAIRALQRRLVEWLLGPRDERAGRRLLGDVSAFASLLMEVNRRPVLIEHDRELLERVEAALRERPDDEAALRRELADLRGRDADLDDLIELRIELRPELWGATLARVLERLSQREDPYTAHEGEHERGMT